MSEESTFIFSQPSRKVDTSWTTQCPHCHYQLLCDLPTWASHGDTWTDGIRCGYTRSAEFRFLWMCSCGKLFLDDSFGRKKPRGTSQDDFGVVMEPSWDEILDFLGAKHASLPLTTRQELATTALWLANQPLRAVLETGQFQLCGQHLEFGREYKWLLMLILEVYREDSCPHGRLLQAEVYRYLRSFDKAENLLDQGDFGSLTPLAQSIRQGIQDQSQLVMRLETSLFWASDSDNDIDANGGAA